MTFYLLDTWEKSFSEIWIKLKSFSLEKIHLKMLFAKCSPFCLVLNLSTSKHSSSHSYSDALNTLRLRHKVRHFPDNIFKCIFLNAKCRNVDWDFTEFCSQGSNKQYSSIGSDVVTWYGQADIPREVSDPKVFLLSSTNKHKLKWQQWHSEMTNDIISQIIVYLCVHGNTSRANSLIWCPRAEGLSIYWITQGLYPIYNHLKFYIHIWSYFMEISNRSLSNPTNNKLTDSPRLPRRGSRSGPRIFHETIKVLSLWRYSNGPWDNAASMAMP